MAAMDAVEDADRDRALPGVELRRLVSDLHGSTVPSTATSSPSHMARTGCSIRRRPLRIASASSGDRSIAGRNGNASAGVRIRSSSASSTENGPTAVRRSDAAVPAERVGDGAHVRPRGDVQLERRHAVLVAMQHELVDRRRAVGHVDVLARAEALVGALALDLHGRGGGHAQHDLAAERLEPLVELLERRRLVLVDRVALDVTGRGRRAEIDIRDVALVEPDEVLREPRRRAEQDEQEAGRERVERSGMARPRAGAVAEPLDDGERRRPRRLVDEHETGRPKRARRHERIPPG